MRSDPGFWASRYAIGLIVIGAVAGYFLLTEHRAHIFGALPFLLLLACPVMHLFMHHGHGGHGGGHAHHHGGEQASSISAAPRHRKTGERWRHVGGIDPVRAILMRNDPVDE